MIRQRHTILSIDTPGRALVEITRSVTDWIGLTTIRHGVLTAFCRHTSASLLIQENAAPEVRIDILDWLDRIAPENGNWRHDDKGPDDMPAHLKSVLTGAGLSIPVIEGRPALGTWQGIYLAEHRARPHRRQIVLQLMGE